MSHNVSQMKTTPEESFACQLPTLAAYMPQHHEKHSATEAIHVFACALYFTGPLGLFTTDPSVTDNHLPPMSIAHKCLYSSSAYIKAALHLEYAGSAVWMQM